MGEVCLRLHLVQKCQHNRVQDKLANLCLLGLQFLKKLFILLCLCCTHIFACFFIKYGYDLCLSVTSHSTRFSTLRKMHSA